MYYLTLQTPELALPSRRLPHRKVNVVAKREREGGFHAHVTARQEPAAAPTEVPIMGTNVNPQLCHDDRLASFPPRGCVDNRFDEDVDCTPVCGFMAAVG